MEEGQNGPLAWNSWTLREDDELWHGFLFVMKEHDQEYYLNIRVKSENGDKETTEK